MMDKVEMETERLLLAPLSEDDGKFIFELVNTKGWLDFIGDRKVHSIDDSIGYIKKILGNADIVYWVVRLKTTRQPAGVITFIKREYLEHPDIGFAFLPAFMDRGYAYEATKAVLARLRNEINEASILSITRPDNLRSIKLLDKLGFKTKEQRSIDNENLLIYEHRSIPN